MAYLTLFTPEDDVAEAQDWSLMSIQLSEEAALEQLNNSDARLGCYIIVNAAATAGGKPKPAVTAARRITRTAVEL